MLKKNNQDFFVALRRFVRHEKNIPEDIRERIGYAEAISLMANDGITMLAWVDEKGEHHTYRFENGQRIIFDGDKLTILGELCDTTSSSS